LAAHFNLALIYTTEKECRGGEELKRPIRFSPAEVLEARDTCAFGAGMTSMITSRAQKPERGGPLRKTGIQPGKPKKNRGSGCRAGRGAESENPDIFSCWVICMAI
jgi:hypothetical protein